MKPLRKHRFRNGCAGDDGVTVEVRCEAGRTKEQVNLCKSVKYPVELTPWGLVEGKELDFELLGITVERNCGTLTEGKRKLYNCISVTRDTISQVDIQSQFDALKKEVDDVLGKAKEYRDNILPSLCLTYPT